MVRVKTAGVGPWDALIREGKSNVSPLPPLTLGSDLSGTVEMIGPGVTDFRVGDEVYGVTNAQFCGAHRSSHSLPPEWWPESPGH
jgi:NADPH:quinone reductase-like Zn-dependent oxidoreductase